MKEQTKKRIVSALLAGTLLFTTGCTSKNKKNDDNNISNSISYTKSNNVSLEEKNNIYVKKGNSRILLEFIILHMLLMIHLYMILK